MTATHLAQIGDEILRDVEAFISRFVAYPSQATRVAHVLWLAHTHAMDAWESTPRLAFLSPEPGSGKSRALEVSELLVPRPVEAVNVSPAYLFRKVSDENGRPTILFDEIDCVFGPKARENEELRGLLNAGHRRHSTAGRCVVRGKEVFTEELPAYCAVALAGLGDLPDTILTRSVIVRMRRRAPTERVEPFRRRVHQFDGEQIRERLELWMAALEFALSSARPEMPQGVEDRAADVWEPLLAVADAAGGEWPSRARVAAVTLVTAAKEGTPSLGVRLLQDLRQVFDEQDATALSTEIILRELCLLDEAPWGDLRGKPLDPRGLSARLRPYGINRSTFRYGINTTKGYQRTDLHDAWMRYLPSSPNASVTSVTTETDGDLVTAVTDVTAPMGGRGVDWDEAPF